MKSIQTVLVFIFIVLIPFQDTALQNTPLKLAGASLSIIPLMLLLCISIVYSISNTDGTIRRSSLVIGIYILIVSVIYFFLVSIAENGFTWHTFAIGLWALSGSMIFATFGINYTSAKAVRVAIYIAFVVTVIGLAVYGLGAPDGISLLHATGNVDTRPRGFSSESSTLSVQIVAIGMLTAHFVKHSWKKWCVGIISCFLLILSGSKGGLMSLIICAIILAIAKAGFSFKRILLGLLLMPLSLVALAFVLLQFSTGLLTASTSVATRLSMAVYAITVVAHNPFGVGFSGFLPSLTQYLPEAIYSVRNISPVPLNFMEVTDYLYTGTNADCKSLFLNFLVFFGIPFALVFTYFMVHLLRTLFKQGHDWLFVGILFSYFALLTYYSSMNAYEIPLLIGVSLHEIKRHKDAVYL